MDTSFTSGPLDPQLFFFFIPCRGWFQTSFPVFPYLEPMEGERSPLGWTPNRRLRSPEPPLARTTTHWWWPGPLSQFSSFPIDDPDPILRSCGWDAGSRPRGELNRNAGSRRGAELAHGEALRGGDCKPTAGSLGITTAHHGGSCCGWADRLPQCRADSLPCRSYVASPLTRSQFFPDCGVRSHSILDQWMVLLRNLVVGNSGSLLATGLIGTSSLDACGECRFS